MGITELGNRSQTLLRQTEGRENLPEKPPFGKNIRQEICVGTMAQTLRI